MSHRDRSRRRALALLGTTVLLSATTASAGSLRFYGAGVNDIDRVKIRIDDPATNVPGPPADIGAGDFTIEFWLRAAAGNNAGPVSCGNAYTDWIEGNIVFDRDRYNQGRTFGIALRGGRVVFATQTSTFQITTICGTTDVRDNAWHHVAVQRDFSNGQMTIYVDGQLQRTGTMAANADISYPDNGVPAGNCGGGACTNSDPFIVLAAEKHDADVARYPSFSGWLDEVRLSTSIRYSASFTPSTSPFTVDAQTAALYHFEEGAGTNTADDNGNQSPAVLRVGGSPAGPEWSTESPFAAAPAAGTLALGAASYSVAENGANVALSVQRTGGSAGAVTVDYATAQGSGAGAATANADFTTATGTLTWASGDAATKTISVPIISDATFEGDETFTVGLSNVTGGATLGRSSSTVTIQDDDPAPAPGTLALSANLYELAESAGTATVTVTRTGGSDGSATATYATTAGTATAADFTARSGSLSWANQEGTSRTITIPILNDSTDEPNEEFQIALGAITGASAGAPTTATIRILDDDAPPAGSLAFTAAQFEGIESTPGITFSVTRTGGSAGPATVQYATTPGTAAATTDYQTTTATLAWADGEGGTKTATIPLVSDTLDETDETLTLTLSGATGATLGTPATATLTILDDDAPAAMPGTLELTASLITVNESATGVAFSVRRIGGSAGGASVQYTTTAGTAAAGSDFQTTSGTLSWTDGNSVTQSRTVVLIPDTVDENDEELTVTLSGVTGATLGATTTATIRILDDDTAAPGAGALDFAAALTSVNESATSATLTVRRTGGSSGAATVQYSTAAGTATAGVDFSAANGTLTWANGDAADKTISVSILGDTTDESDEELTVTLTNVTGASLGATTSATVRIVDDDAAASGGGGGGGSVGWLTLLGLLGAARKRRAGSPERPAKA